VRVSFFQIVDELTGNRKVQKLTHQAMTGDIRGLAALGVWTIAGSMCKQSGTDGVVSTEMLLSQVLNLDVLHMGASLLVEVGLWHAPGHDCTRCCQPPEGSWIFHDWWDLRYETAAKEKVTRGKRAELKDRKITDAVWARDRVGSVLPGGDAIAPCRYCGTLVHRRSRGQWQFDHVDPRLYVGATNIVVACTDCNKQKMQRPLEESGMTLHRPGWTPGEPDWKGPRVVDGRADAGTPAVESGQGEESRATALADSLPTRDSRKDAPPAPDTAAAPHGKPSGSRSGNIAAAAAARSGVSTRARAGQGRAGQGREGEEEGPRRGAAGQGEPPHAHRKRRRRRSRKPRNPQIPTPAQPSHGQDPQGQAPPVGLAGTAPDPGTPGRFGSPWYGWRGRPPDDAGEATCLEHGEPVPCRRCLEEQWRAEAEQ
jgi:5-methylcytosine-specific restriction endonuclease McrA